MNVNLGGQAADRQALVYKSGYQIAYVLDGVGNFQRFSAISTICIHSDCTVADKYITKPQRQLER